MVYKQNLFQNTKGRHLTLLAAYFFFFFATFFFAFFFAAIPLTSPY